MPFYECSSGDEASPVDTSPQAKPRGAWVPEQKQFRWELSDMPPGASLLARVAFPPVPKQADIAQGAKVGAHLVCVPSGCCPCQCLNARYSTTESYRFHDEAIRQDNKCNAVQKDRVHASCSERHVCIGVVHSRMSRRCDGSQACGCLEGVLFPKVMDLYLHQSMLKLSWKMLHSA